nr:MAG: ORF1 [Torque teno midi virus]
MAFYWRRRNKNWYGRRFTWRRRRRNNWRTRRRRPIRRRRRRRTYRRRSKRRGKVRRKKKKITIQQWQPESVVNCKIKGHGVLIVGAEGRQMYCYTPNRYENTIPRTPYGGGFGAEQYTLQYLYDQYTDLNNIWTRSNKYKDLCRYRGTKITFYRDQKTDFIISYSTQPPFNLNKYTYPACHPQQMLLQRKKKIILSKLSKPGGKLKKSIFIKPPKQMESKWFFSQNFAKYPLFFLKGTACQLNYSYLSCCNENMMVTIIYLNPLFYQLGNWGNQAAGPYKPWATIPNQLNFTYKKNNTEQAGHIPNINNMTYQLSVGYSTGFFQAPLLQAIRVDGQAALPTGAARYNPLRDDGRHSKMWLSNILNADHTKPSKDNILLLEGMPLWLGIWGWLDFITEMKKDPTFLRTYYIVLQSAAIYPAPQVGADTYYIPIDRNFWLGQEPYQQYLTSTDKSLWYPTIKHQVETLNEIAKSGPYVPKYNDQRESNWELKYTYTSFFKWGGPQISEQAVEDPTKQGTYDLSSSLPERLQIQNPSKQTPQSILHAWDTRRGFITETALKRMCENLSTDTSFQPDSEEQRPKKRQKTAAHLQNPQKEQEETQACLHSLFEEDTSQEEEEAPDLLKLIHKQQQKQLKIKHNLIKLIADLKTKQKQLQLQTGLLD